MAKKYWSCLIGGEIDELSWSSDFPLRQAVRKAYKETIGEPDEVCASGWGIDEERYNLLRIIGLMSTEEIKKMLETKSRTFTLKNKR